jgi:hypothetical protein
VSLNLNAKTIRPVLSIDKKKKADGLHYMNFNQWSVVTQDSPANIKKFCFTNETMADLTFNLNVDGQFEIINTKTNSGAVHPLSRPTSSAKSLIKKVETMFCLQPAKIVEITLKFSHPSPNDNDKWPNIMKKELNGVVNIHYANGAEQKLMLLGRLLRPRLKL